MAIRVLHLVYFLNHGGIENWLLDLCTAVDRSEIEIEIACRGVMGGVLEPQFRELGIPIHFVPMRRSHASFGRQLAHLLREGKFDLLHVHAGSFAGYPCRVAVRSGVGSVTTFHNTHFPFEVTGLASMLNRLRAMYTRRSFRTVCREGQAVIACSEAAKKAVVELSGVAADDRYYVVPCGTGKSPGRSEEVRRAVREELGLSAETPVGIHVGIFKDQKNHAGLIRVADHVRRLLPEFQLLLVGQGPLRPDIERQVEELNLGQTVRLLGSRNDVDRLLQAADVLIFPSLWEGLPVAVTEAEMKGLPVVGSDIPPLHEATRVGETSLLFPLDQERKMAEAVADLLGDTKRREAMGRAATQLAMERFSIQSNVIRHKEIYSQALSRIRGQRR